MPKLTTQQLRDRVGNVCIPIVATTVDDLLAKAMRAIQDVSFLEFRLDYLPQPQDALPALRTFLTHHTSVSAIATCRRSPNGGQFHGSVTEELDLLAAAAAAGCQIVDVEIETAESLQSIELDRLRSSGASVIISYHSFTGTADLDHVAHRILALHPDLAKIVPTAQCLTDNLTLLELTNRLSKQVDIIAMSMGESGVPSRVLGPRYGSAFTFGSLAAGDESAPGQVTAHTLLDLYRIRNIGPDTAVFGVAGNHVRSSLSPLMHNTAFRHDGVDAVYLPLQTSEISDLLSLVHGLPLKGLSVTMPFKQQVLPFLDHIDPLATRIGAVNTILRSPDGKLHGSNTDVAGITDPLEQRLSLKGARVVVLGAGGAARAAVFGLMDKGAHVAIVNRSPETAQALAQQTGAAFLPQRALDTERFDVLVNATPIGMTGFESAASLAPKQLRTELVFDLVYNPIETPLLAMAREQGISVIAGLEMFVAQGAKQFEIWTERKPPEDAMQSVVRRALQPTGTDSQ